MPQRLLICFAFATWCFLNTWVELAERESTYFARQDPLNSVAIPVICWEFLIAFGMFGLWTLCRDRGLTRLRWAHFLFLAACAVPVGIASVAVLRLVPMDSAPLVRSRWFWAAAGIPAVAAITYACRRPFAASRGVRTILLYSWPLLAVVLIEGWFGSLLRYPAAAYADGPPAPAISGAPTRVRVLWIIFDELSQTIAFDNRPAGLRLPEFDRLKEESFFASRAHAPATVTKLSLPDLILGERIAVADAAGPRELRLRGAKESEPFSWSSRQNVFDEARAMGFNTALVGWYHPYGRLLNRSLTRVYWTATWLTSGVEEPADRLPLLRSMWRRAELQAAALPLVGHTPFFFPGIFQRRAKIRRYSYLLDRACDLAKDASIGLALIHLPVPHPPGIYNRSTGEWSPAGRVDYLDNVALSDRALGALRGCIADAGLAENTAILVSSDHGWRTANWRGNPEWTAEDEAASHQDTSGSPFLLKLPRQTSEVSYDKPFDTIVSRRLIIAILRGGLAPAGVADEIERASISAP
jgi:hypothetical protein